MRILIPVLFAALPTTALADPQLTRLEAVSERLTDTMILAMADMMEANGMNATAMRAVAPKIVWNDEVRGAAACTLDLYTQETSPEAVTDMIDRMEALIPELKIESFEAFEGVPDITPTGMTQARSDQISAECGLTDASMKVFEEAGFMAAMMGG